MEQLEQFINNRTDYNLGRLNEVLRSFEKGLRFFQWYMTEEIADTLQAFEVAALRTNAGTVANSLKPGANVQNRKEILRLIERADRIEQKLLSHTYKDPQSKMLVNFYNFTLAHFKTRSTKLIWAEWLPFRDLSY